MCGRLRLSTVAGLLLVVSSSPVAAEAPPVVAVKTVGRGWLGRAKMQDTLVAAFEGAALRVAGEPLRLGRAARRGVRVKAIARSGREVGARWVVVVKLRKEKKPGKPPFLAKARLIDADNAEVAVRFATRYGRGGAIAAGRQIADRLIGLLAPDVEVGAVGEAPPELPPPPAEPPPRPDDPTVEPLEGEPTDALPPPAPPNPAFVPAEDAAEAPEVEEARWTSGGTVEPAPEVEVEAPPPPAEEASWGRVQLGAGSGWVRSVEVSSDAGDSQLSHSLGPNALLTLSGELLAPDLGLGGAVSVGLRPVRYAIQTRDGVDEPGGTVLDLLVRALYRVSLGPLALLPTAGLRLSNAAVAEHEPVVVPSNRTLAIVAGLSVRVPIVEVLEIELGGHAGFVPLYAESPSDTGDSAGGFTVGALLSVRAALVAGFGLALDARLGYDALSFSDAPSRTLPPAESDLTDARMTVLEASTTLSVTYAF